MGASALGGAGAVLAAEVCAPLLLLCWLCCWPDDSSDTSSGKHPQKPVITNEANSHRRSNELFSRRFGSSAVSLHLPSTSGIVKQTLSAHKSHEDIRTHRRSQLEPAAADARYHSAPSVIDEVLHRRDWDRSARDLYVPLRPGGDSFAIAGHSPQTDARDTAQQSDEQIVGRPCKKHYTNIKSSRKKNAETADDIKDYDATEIDTESTFYIGDNEIPASLPEAEDKAKVYKPKETKQSLNESIRCKERRQTLVPVEEFIVSRFEEPLEVDRSGAVHHTIESRSSLYNPHGRLPHPPSVEAVGYDSDASYLSEDAGVGAGAAGVPGAGAGWGGAFVRARHASAGDVLAPTARPQSGALSESDLDFDLEACNEVPPAYHEVRRARDRKETAI